MTEEVKDQQQTADAGQETDEKGKEDKTSETTDYKAELEKVKKQLGQAEHAIIQLKKKENDEQEEEDDPIPDNEAVQEIARKEAAKLFATATKSQARMLARSLSDNADEVDLILFHYENSITATGDMEIDLRRAKLLANEGRISKDLEQAQKAAFSKGTKGQATGESGQRFPDEQGPKLSTTSRNFLEKQGFTWDAKRKGWVGKSGRFHSEAEMEKQFSKREPEEE